MVDVSDYSRGVLVDFDIAARVRDGDKVLEPVLTYAGTLPFRSIDLLYTGTHYPTRAMYRDDLESFFYVLVYIQKYYLDGHRLPTHDTLGWSNIGEGGIRSLATQKRAWLRSATITESPLASEWLEPLHSLFKDAYLAQEQFERPGRQPFTLNLEMLDAMSPIGSESSESSEAEEERGGGKKDRTNIFELLKVAQDAAPAREWGLEEEETQDGRLTFKSFMAVIQQ